MPEGKAGFRGDLLKWARVQRKLTLREVSAATGVAFSYLSELENGKKTEPRSDRLEKVVHHLGITDAFARGHVPCYKDEPLKCRRLAAEVGDTLMKGFIEDKWANSTVSHRCSEVLRRITDAPELPKMVLAYVLGISLESLEEYLAGSFSAPPLDLVKALSEITALPISFFRHGQLDEPPVDRDMRDLVEEIQRRGIPLAEVRQWLRSRY